MRFLLAAFLLPFHFLLFNPKCHSDSSKPQCELLSGEKDQVKVPSGELGRPNVLSMSFYSDALTSWGLADT